jgi:hypothetical protein
MRNMGLHGERRLQKLVRNHHNELRRIMWLIGWRSVGRHQSRCLEYGGFTVQERG